MLSGLMSATFGPAGGMGFPTVLERGESGLSEILRPSKPNCPVPTNTNRASVIMEEDSPIRPQVAHRAAVDFEPFRDESEANEDQKSPGYPDGPVAIYDDNVYLYLEPTAEEAAKFDVVINVAHEVLNPFNGKLHKEPEAPAPSEPVAESPIPGTALTTDSFATAFEFPMEDRMDTPTTPKAANPFREPEYIHMPWDHNTDITTDLMSLCETIEKRTKEDKKVLVHCQQGASRSASLIIAYGLYQNPGMSVNDAYYAAQTKSKWISPNMKLMYCLQDFQKEVAKKRMPRSAAGPRSGRSPTKHRLTLSADAIDIKPKEPLSAPLPDENSKAEGSSRDGSPARSRRKSSPSLDAISPGPSSAPSTFSWSEKEDEKYPDKFGFKFNLEKSLNLPKFFEPEAESKQDSNFPPSSSSFFKPPPSPGFRPAMTLGFRSDPSLSFKSPPSLSFKSTASLGFKSIPSLGFKPPPSPGFFPSSSQEFKPPPSPGFGAHRYGHIPQSLGFSNFNFGSSDSSLDGDKDVPTEREIHITRALPDDDALMSPRAETMTNNPLHDSFSELAGMKFVEVPPTPSEGLFSPRETMFPRDPFYPFGRPTQVADPRSPPTKGESPIVRSIDELI
jgi:tyrosine-protein phosphatase